MTTTLSPTSINSESTDEPVQETRSSGRPHEKGHLRATRAPDPRWARPTLLGLLGVTAVLYIWGLGAEGWANAFYAAAVQAGTKSWKAFFFGSFDASNFITVDKPPGSLWVMELSARIFGLNSWSLLVPEALEGVATVGLLYATVKRWFGPSAGLIAGAVVALTPVAALMFRYDNPDALLVLLLTAAGYATTRALETGRTRWLVCRDVARRHRVHHQDAAGVPRPARDRSCLLVRRAAEAGAPCRSARPELGGARRRRPDGGSRSSSSSRHAIVPTSAARRTTTFSTSSSATTASAGSRAVRQEVLPVNGAPRAGTECSYPRSVVRSRG